jgi:lysophospholipase L1-like esterase
MLARNAKRTVSPVIRRRIHRLSLMAVLLAMALASLAFSPAAYAGERHDNDRDQRWIATWGASPSATVASGFNNQTLRLIVHTSIGGDDVRVRLSNALGTQSVVIGAAHIALRSTGAAIVPGSDRPLTFSGASSITIPPNALVVSDPVELDVPALGDLAVSIYLPVSTGPASDHDLGEQTSYVSTTGDFTASPGATPYTTTITQWPYLAGVEVKASEDTRAIVALGDSITDGFNSTPDANHRWPNFLAARLLAHHRKRAVVDEGISGNRILHDIAGPNALGRYDRDVLVQSGVKYVIVLEGINDIGFTAFIPSEAVTADQIIAGHLQLIERAHARGLKIYGATLTPFEGTTFPGYFTPEGEVKREAVNNFIRTSGAYDAVIDFDAATRDPSHPTRLLPAYDSGDHLHPNDAGYQAMANAIDLALFRRDEDERDH